MKLQIFDMPDDRTEQRAWLELQLVGLELGKIVAELSAVHAGETDSQKSLEDLLGTELDTILTQGLANLSDERLQTLMQNPQQLLSLQERILVEGGPFWDSIQKSNSTLDTLAKQTWNQLAPQIESDKPAGQATTHRPSHWFTKPSVVSLATAAAVLAMVFGWNHFKPVSPPTPSVATWGWDKPGAIPENVDAATYLTKLSDAGGQWFKKRPESPEALARRILQFRQGCSTLILAKHKPLDTEDRKWLVERCRAWATKLDQHLADIESGADVQKVRTDTDETINKLIAALKKRAAGLS